MQRYTCGQDHDRRNPNWKPFQHLARYCLQEGLDDFEVRDFLQSNVIRVLSDRNFIIPFKRWV